MSVTNEDKPVVGDQYLYLGQTVKVVGINAFPSKANGKTTTKYEVIIETRFGEMDAVMFDKLSRKDGRP